jgi:hypothetical protein
MAASSSRVDSYTPDRFDLARDLGQLFLVLFRPGGHPLSQLFRCRTHKKNLSAVHSGWPSLRPHWRWRQGRALAVLWQAASRSVSKSGVLALSAILMMETAKDWCGEAMTQNVPQVEGLMRLSARREV